MNNLRFNYNKRKDVRRAIMSGFTTNPESGSSRANNENTSGSIVANQANAMSGRMCTYDAVKLAAKQVGDSIVALALHEQMDVIKDMQAMVDSYKEVFEEVKSEYGYHGTFEQYIEDVLRIAESVDSDTPMEQIGNMVLNPSNRLK